MTFDLTHIWAEMGILAKSVAFGLFLMAIASIAVVVERTIAFAKGNSATKSFVAKAGPILESWQLEKMSKVAEEHKASPLARVFRKMTNTYLNALGNSHNMSPAEMARNEGSRQLEAAGQELRRGMNVLASVGSVAPFVGLLGTVIGIIGAFQGIGASGSAGLAAVSSGIAEALIETAFGLLVAIPAVLFFNFLSSKVNSMELALGRSVGELLDEMENNHGRESSDRRSEKAA